MKKLTCIRQRREAPSLQFSNLFWYFSLAYLFAGLMFGSSPLSSFSRCFQPFALFEEITSGILERILELF